jgi:putative phosphoesterase
MKIAILSDIHENYHNLVLFCEKVQEMKVDKIIFLGDFCNKGMAKILANTKIPTFAIWGNNDAQKMEISHLTEIYPNFKTSLSDNTFDFLELAGRKFFLTHWPNLVESMAKSGDFDAVFYGHTHISEIKKIENCLILNPGEISSHISGKCTFAVYDTEKNEAEIVELNDFINTKTKKARDFFEKQNLKF